MPPVGGSVRPRAQQRAGSITMFSAHYYLATALPALGEPGTAPPLSLVELRAATAESRAAPLIDAILLSDDLRQRQAVLAGELTEAVPAVLEPAQATGQAPLPAALMPAEGSESLPASDDLLWETYWYYSASVARRRGSAFLRAWVSLEVALRNAVAEARARSFAQRAAVHVVAAELGEHEQLVELGVAAWAGAPDPLTGLRSLLRTRWEWVTREEPRFTFSDDELAAYAVKLLVLRNWRRTMEGAA